MTRQGLSRRAFLQVTATAGGLLAGVSFSVKAGRRVPGAADASPDPTMYVRIAPDNVITLSVTKSEMGQGVRTSLAMLLAEELDADWATVRLEQASYEPRFLPLTRGDVTLNTGGSGSVLDNWYPLRSAGATLRAMLVATAAARWGVPEAECATRRAHVIHPGSKRRLSYGSLGRDATARTVPTGVPLKKRSEFSLIGTPQRNRDARDLVHGRSMFGIDVQLPGLLHASIERAPVFDGRIASFDDTATRRSPGVVAVIQMSAIANGVHTRAGVAVIAADTWAAIQGRRALRLDWTPSPRLQESTPGYSTTMRANLAKGGMELLNRLGDPDRRLAEAAETVTAEYELPFLAHATMEPQNCTASVRGQYVEIWAPTQFPVLAAEATARVLGIPVANVRVRVTRVGGGFGRRFSPDFVVEAAVLSQKLQRPVKVTWTREDDLRNDFYRPCALHHIDAALGPDGHPIAWRHRFTTPAIGTTWGALSDLGVGMDEAEGAVDMFYDIPNRSCEFALLESGVPRGYWRAVNTTHTVFAVESMIDELARRASRDPLEYRLALIDKVRVDQPPQSVRFPFNPDRMKAVLRLAGEKAGWGGSLPAGHAQGVACSYDHVTYVAEVVELSVARGAVQVHRVVCAADAGPIVNPLGARAQVEGAITQGLSAVLHERITISGAAVEQDNFDGYRLLRVNEAPARIEVHFIETDTRPTGLGEPALPPLGPAVANAIHQATGRRLRNLPLGPQLGSAG